MSDLIERAREASTLKYQYHTIHVPTILIRMADEADKAAAELSALQALHAAGSAPYDAEIDRLQKRNVELTAEVAALRADGERLGYIASNARCDPHIDGTATWWPTSFNHRLIGPTLRDAIDSARAKESGDG